MNFRSKSLLFALSGLIVSVAVAETLTIETIFGIAEKLGAFKTTIHPKLERAEDQESENIKQIATLMFKAQMQQEPKSRDAHAKGHGCAEAQVQIESDIPDDYRVGTFSEPGKTFDAIIRYSNGASTTQVDSIVDAKGMAVKIIGAAPEPGRNLLGTGTTQDLMMIDGPEFFIRSIHDYRLFTETLAKDGKADNFILARAIREALTEGQISNADQISDESIAKIGAGVSRLPNPLPLEGALLSVLPAWRVPTFTLRLLAKLKEVKTRQAPLELRRIAHLQRLVGSTLTESYFSMASYLLAAKSGDTAVKYSTHPIDCSTGETLEPTPVPENPAENYLREDLAARLESGPACFELTIQPLPAGLSDDQRRTLVEDSVLSYDSPEVAVARITLPRQRVDTPERQAYCANLSFNPWQTRAEHQPLGSMNRARKVAVTASSIRRHLVVGSERVEPTSLEKWRSLK